MASWRTWSDCEHAGATRQCSLFLCRNSYYSYVSPLGAPCPTRTSAQLVPSSTLMSQHVSLVTRVVTFSCDACTCVTTTDVAEANNLEFKATPSSSNGSLVYCSISPPRPSKHAYPGTKASTPCVDYHVFTTLAAGTAQQGTGTAQAQHFSLSICVTTTTTSVKIDFTFIFLEWWCKREESIRRGKKS